MDIRNSITQQLRHWKIEQAQIDPFGYCNAKCWFCPVKYSPNPPEGKVQMPIELFEKIIDDMLSEKSKDNGIVSKKFNGIYTAHYNEVLLYKYFEKMLEVLSKRNLYTMILSNGINLTPEKIEIIKKHERIISGICLNIPAFEPELWEKRSGINQSRFPQLIENINYARTHLSGMVARKAFSIQVNGIDETSKYQNNGWLEIGFGAPDFRPNENEQQLQLAKSMFPEVNCFKVPHLIDRAGKLHQLGIISNKKAIDKHLKKSEVVGCFHGDEIGGRPFGYLHVNAAGDLFLCCHDYDFETSFGNITNTSLQDVWFSEKHVDVIEHSFKNFCNNCASSKWSN